MLLRIKIERVTRDMTIFDLSGKSSISTGRLSMLERGLVKPTEDERLRLATALNTSASKLFKQVASYRKSTKRAA